MVIGYYIPREFYGSQIMTGRISDREKYGGMFENPLLFLPETSILQKFCATIFVILIFWYFKFNLGKLLSILIA